MATRIETYIVDGPPKVHVLFYDDGTIRFRVYAAPFVIEEAFLGGNGNGHSIIKLTPREKTNGVAK